MKRAHTTFLYLLLLSCFFPQIFAQENKPISSFFTDKALSLKLYESREWQKILFYQRKYFTKKRGIVDGKDFYLSEDGKLNPEHEMKATIESFFSGKQGDNAPQCLFPRRLNWLKEKLDTNDLKIPTIDCPKLRDWLLNINPKGVALVFSSFYINNPSSMFGHTFLRIINSDYSLTDYGVNYAANPDTSNMLLYTFKGLTGMFEGKFSLLPYSVKVQEYNNSESRDLYEYELNLSPAQALNMILSLWEVGDNRIDYYYFDENCSYILLALLDTANPDFNFDDKFLFFVNPADTLRVVNNYPNLVKDVSLRPSSERRFKTRYKVLDGKERDLFAQIVDEKISPALFHDLTINPNPELVSKESAAKILTAASEYIDYKEHIAGTGDPLKYPLKRKEILKARAELGVISPPLDIPISKEDAPENGVYGSRLGASYNYSTKTKSFINFELRPMLHDINSPSQGYSKEAQIELANTVISYEAKTNRVYLNKFSLVDIQSLPSLDPPLYPVAWGLQAALEQDEDCQVNSYSERCERYYLSGLSGFSWRQNVVQIYFLPNLQLSYMDDFGSESLMGAKAGFLILPTVSMTIAVSGELLKRYSFLQSMWRSHQNAQSSISFKISKEMESRTYLSFNLQNAQWNFGTGLYWYFY